MHTSMQPNFTGNYLSIWKEDCKHNQKKKGGGGHEQIKVYHFPFGSYVRMIYELKRPNIWYYLIIDLKWILYNAH
jgi:hypothetical protein